MKEHTVIWYESEDGKIFIDQMDCIKHEAKLLYEKSGVRFYTYDWSAMEFETENDYTYNVSDFIVINRENENNKRFVDYMCDNFGWCLLRDAYNMNGDTFILEKSEVVPLSSHLVY